MSKQLDTLTAEVTEVQTVEESAIALINGLAAKIDEANGDTAKLDALSAQLKSNAAKLGAAVAANTPATTPAPTPGVDESGNPLPTP